MAALRDNHKKRYADSSNGKDGKGTALPTEQRETALWATEDRNSCRGWRREEQLYGLEKKGTALLAGVERNR